MSARDIIKQAESALSAVYDARDEVAYQNQVRVIEAFKEFRVREHHFYPSSGYGYGDAGRDNLENIYARVFAGEDA
ncbi:MAG: methionine gamma-lyase family protein, partial [Syntrophomonadaceae bacterium]|nr:methionine gamma-lyase family protein [Syntrophomonadaceae bacterium]